jgi:hypothetical protein
LVSTNAYGPFIASLKGHSALAGDVLRGPVDDDVVRTRMALLKKVFLTTKTQRHEEKINFMLKKHHILRYYRERF